jgi:signal transduction histidine kinase
VPSTDAFARLERTVRLLALTLGTLITIAVPAGFGLQTYFDDSRTRQFQAKLMAERVSQYVYVQGPLWRFTSHKVTELISFAMLPDDAARAVVSDAAGTVVVSLGEAVPGPRYSVREPIVLRAETFGYVTLEASLNPVLASLGMFALIGAALGISVYASVHILPLRVLHRTMESLDAAQADLRAEVKKTEAALESAQAAQQRAELASRAKSEFLANMSHELRTPLNAIIGFADTMKMALLGPLDGHYRDYSNDISISGNHLLAIINDLLDLAKIEAGRDEISLGPCELDRLLLDCRRLIQGRADDAGLTLAIDNDPATPQNLHVDAIKTKQILINLLSNAVKYTPAGGTVTLSARDAGAGWVAISVADTGIGMSADDLKLAMQPFRQVDNSYTRKHQGTGLGLPLAKVLTERHGGTLDVVSAPKKGTVVTVRLPTAAALAA